MAFRFDWQLVSCALTLLFIDVIGHQNVPPGVPPQHYQQAHVPQMHQVPVQQQHIPVQQQQHIPVHHQQQQQIPVQQQQVPLQQQQVPLQQQQVPVQQQQVPVQQQQHHVPVQQHIPMQQVPVQQQMHQQGHHHDGPPQVLNVANIAQEKQHIQDHLSVPIDTSKMSEQELQFHYFKMHDADNNNKLDGCELIKSLIHWHEQGHGDTGKGQGEDKLFKDDELVSLIDPILALDDANSDGYIDYPEFVRAQQKAAASQQPPTQQQQPR